MKRRFAFATLLALCCALGATDLLIGPPAHAGGGVRTVDGQSFWRGDPGPIDPGPYWTSGQYKYDPNGYLDQINRSADQLHDMTVYADHSGKERCVFRKRVIIDNWEYHHPVIRVCRP